MQTIDLSGLKKLLHPERSQKTVTEQFLKNLSRSNYGLQKNTVSESASRLDSFELTKNVFELLSPACGMTEEEKSSYMQKILSKLKSGKKLTPEEMRFLQAENPVLYQQAARVQTMRASLEARLKQCQSKQEADNVYADALSLVSDDDPMKECIVAAYDDAFKEFKETEDYQSLPQTEDEKEKSTRR